MVNYAKLPTFAKSLVRVVVESPRGSALKFKYDPESHTFLYGHPLPAGTSYPYDWGFIPSTLGEDGDPLDGMVIHKASSSPGIVIKCQLLGCLRVHQSEKGRKFRNDRFLFCPIKEDAEDEKEVANGVPDELKREIEQFFLASVLNSDKNLTFKGWQDAKYALRAIKKGHKAFLAEEKK